MKGYINFKGQYMNRSTFLYGWAVFFLFFLSKVIHMIWVDFKILACTPVAKLPPELHTPLPRAADSVPNF